MSHKKLLEPPNAPEFLDLFDSCIFRSFRNQHLDITDGPFLAYVPPYRYYKDAFGKYVNLSISSLSRREIDIIKSTFKKFAWHFLLQYEQFDKELIPVMNHGRMGVYLNQFPEPFQISDIFTESLIRSMASLGRRPRKMVILRDEGGFWEAVLTYLIYPTTIRDGPELNFVRNLSEANVLYSLDKAIPTSWMEGVHRLELVLYLFKRSLCFITFSALIKLRIAIDISNRLMVITKFIDWFFNWLQENEYFELMVFFIIFFVEFPLEDLDDNCRKFTLHERQLVETKIHLLFQPLEGLLNLKSDPYSYSNKRGKAFLFEHLNPLRSYLKKKWESVRERVVIS